MWTLKKVSQIFFFFFEIEKSPQSQKSKNKISLNETSHRLKILLRNFVSMRRLTGLKKNSKRDYSFSHQVKGKKIQEDYSFLLKYSLKNITKKTTRSVSNIPVKYSKWDYSVSLIKSTKIFKTRLLNSLGWISDEFWEEIQSQRFEKRRLHSIQ